MVTNPQIITGRSKKNDKRTEPAMMPINTTVPPSTGIGIRCNLRALGLSTILCLFANRNTCGNAIVDTNSAAKETMIAINVFVMFFIIYHHHCFLRCLISSTHAAYFLSPIVILVSKW